MANLVNNNLNSWQTNVRLNREMKDFSKSFKASRPRMKSAGSTPQTWRSFNAFSPMQSTRIKGAFEWRNQAKKLSSLSMTGQNL